MRLNCEVQVSNRSLPALSINNKKSSARSSLGIGRNPGSKADVSSLFIHLCTAQNKQGTKYKIHQNIEAVFTKFVSEGKFTIRFKEPAHDLCVKSEPVLAKTFLQTLKLGLQNKSIDKLHLSSLAPVKQSQVEKPKTKLIITTKKEYPITTSFPYTLEFLKVTDVGLSRVENRMIKLKRLQVLDLGHNMIQQLPTHMGEMQNLAELHLPHNKLSRVNHRVFQGNVSKTLKLLDLCNNELEYLPHTLGRLRSLITLKLDGNCLRKLPISLGKLSGLKFLSATDNKLVELPATISNLRMDTVGLCGNPFSSDIGLVKNRISGVPNLKEIASAHCIRRGLRPTAADVPATLVEYMQSWMKCFCGKICYESHILSCTVFNLKQVTSSLVIDNSLSSYVPVLATLCSQKCFDKYARR